ncbi:hypothetical protein KPATCC21470_3000 [Kitasatospora purpeofusca]
MRRRRVAEGVPDLCRFGRIPAQPMSGQTLGRPTRVPAWPGW